MRRAFFVFIPLICCFYAGCANDSDSSYDESAGPGLASIATGPGTVSVPAGPVEGGAVGGDFDLTKPENKSWFEQVQANIEADERRPTLQKQDQDGALFKEPRWHFVNRRHNLRAYVDTSGWRLEEQVIREDLDDSDPLKQRELTGEGKPTAPSREKWWWEYKFLGLGGEQDNGKLAVKAAATPNVFEEEEVVYRKHSKTLWEWYKNPATGFKQGFTISERPNGIMGRLAIVGEVKTSLKLTASEPQKIAFSNNGKLALQRGTLSVKDATGRQLANTMSIKPKENGEGYTLSFLINDAGAKYPISVD